MLIELSDDRAVRDKSLSSIGQFRKERRLGCAGCLVNYRSLRGCTAAFVLPPIGSHFFITHGADVFLHNGYSVLGMFFHPACISRSWLAAMPTGRHSPVPRQL